MQLSEKADVYASSVTSVISVIESQNILDPLFTPLLTDTRLHG